MTAKRKAAAVLVGLLIAGLLALIWFFSAQPDLKIEYLIIK